MASPYFTAPVAAVIAVQSVAELRAVASNLFVAGALARLLGITSPQKFYDWSTTSTAADDAVNVIKPDDIGGGAPGRWLASNVAAAALAAVPTIGDKDLSPLATSGNNSTTGLTISATPTADGAVTVRVNGIVYNLGNGVKTSHCYFSVDGGLTARLIKDITTGDTLFWNGPTVGLELVPADDVDFAYDV